MKRLVMFVSTGLFVAPAALVAQAAPCLIVTITGSRGGAGLCNGLAGPGTLVRYGDESDKCNAVRLQFDAGRGTRLRLSQVLTCIPITLKASSMLCNCVGIT